MNGACRCPFPRSHLRPIRRRREKRDRTVMGRERTTSGTGVTTSMSLTFRSLTVHTVPVPFASRVAAAEPANGTGYERWAWEAKGLWDERSGRWIHSKFCQSSGLFTHIILLLPTSSPPPVACRSLRHEKRRWCEGEEWGEVDSVPVIILVLLSIILSSYNPYPSETGPKGRAPVSPAHLTSFGAGKRAPPGMVSGVNRVPVVFSLSFTPLLITHSPYVTHVTRSAHHSCRRRVERTEGNRRWEERDKGRMIGEGSCHCVALASVPFPRPFRPFVVRSLTPSFVPHVGRSVPHFLRNDGTEEWRDGVKVERNRGRPFARYASLSLGRFVPPSHPRRRRVALTSLAPVSDGNGNNMRE